MHAQALPFNFMFAAIFAALLASLKEAAKDLFDGLCYAVTHPTAMRNTLADTVVDSLDVGGAGTLVFQTTASATVATLTFSATAFGSASSGTATANAITSDTNAAGGTITKAELRNNAGTAKVLCSVTATGGGGDIELNSVVVSAAQTVSMTSLTYSAPA